MSRSKHHHDRGVLTYAVWQYRDFPRGSLVREPSDARLVVPLSSLVAVAGFGRCGGGVALAEVFDARLAEGALDDLKVETDIVSQPLREDSEQVAAELFARGAGESAAAPDLAQ